MVVNKRYAQHLGEVMIQKHSDDQSYQRFADLQAIFDSSEPLYIDRAYAETDYSRE